MKMQSKRWVTNRELMLLCEVTARRSVWLWKSVGMPAHKVLAVAGGHPRVAYDVVEVMDWFLRTGRAVPVKLAAAALEVRAREATGKRLKTDDILSEIVHGDDFRDSLPALYPRVRMRRARRVREE